MVILHGAMGEGAMVAWRRDFSAVFGAMQDYDAVPHNAMQYNHDAISHDAIQKRSYCKKFTYPVYFVLKF
jgi:hypothetical protein